MIRIKVTYPYKWPLVRQTPHSSSIWADCKFYINEPIKECDYWVVYGDLLGRESTICPPENIIYFCGEPPTIEILNQQFLEQFAAIVTCHAKVKHRKSILRHQALPWMAGISYLASENRWLSEEAMTYEDFDAASPIKERLISVISSDKTTRPGHALRLEFVKRLEFELGQKIDVFGRGLKPIADKWDALAPYRYHVVLENSAVANYWTEKLADAILAGAYPIYYGSPNICDSFDHRSLTQIDIAQPDRAIETIKKVIGSDIDRATIDIRKAAKQDLMQRHNFFPYVLTLRDELESASFPRPMTISPKSSFFTMRGRLKQIKELVLKRASRFL